MPLPKPPAPEEDEELDELPPMDGGDGDEAGEDPTGGAAEELDDVEGDDGDPLDDSTGEGDPIDEDLETAGSETGWLEDAGDAEGLDVGTPEAFGSEEEEGSSLLDGAEEDDAGEDDLPVQAEEASHVGDAGEEGFEDEEEEVREADLPPLDAGPDDVEPDDSDLHTELPDDDEDDARPPWNDRAWERVDGGSPAPDELGAVRGLPEGRYEAVAWDAARGDALGLVREGATWRLVRGKDGRFEESSGAGLPAGKVESMGAYDGRVALAHPRGAFTLEAGEWRRVEGTTRPTAIAFTEAGSLVVALYSDGEGSAWLVEVREGAPASIVAELGDAAAAGAGEDGEGARIRELAWDAAAGVVWATGSFGRVAFRPTRR